MAKSEFRTYLDDNKELPDDCILGWLVAYTIRDANYERDALEKLFDELGLSPAYLPAPNNPLHAFEKATSSVNDFEYDMPTQGHVAHVLVREAREDGERVERKFVREVRDKRKGRLEHAVVGEAVYYRPATRSGKVDYSSARIRLTVDPHGSLKPGERQAMQPMLDKIGQAYDRHVNYMDAMKYRAVIRDYLVFLNALKVKDGLYFVTKAREAELTALATVVERMGGGSAFYMIPLPHLQAQKTMIVEAYTREAEETFNDVVKEIAHIRQSRKKVTPAAVAKLEKEFQRAVLLGQEYKRELRLRTTVAEGAQELALDALSDLKMSVLGGVA